MKKIIITFLLFIIGIANRFAQMVFTVIDVAIAKEAFSIVTARDIYGRTIQFQVGIKNFITNTTDKKIVKPSKPPRIGAMVTALFNPEKPPCGKLRRH